MLLTPKTIADQIMMDLHHHCAEDPITGAYLIKSNGRRKLGRRTRFWYHAPGMINAKAMYATSVEDAICQIECGIEVPAEVKS
jgi:hypothetical protein